MIGRYHCGMVRFARTAFFLGLFCIGLITLANAAGKPELTPEQKAEVRAIRKAFSSAGKKLDKQQAAVADAVKAGPHAAGPLVRALQGRYKGLLKKYKASVSKAAKKLGSKRLVTTVDEFLEANPKLQKARGILQATSDMHAELTAVMESAVAESEGESSADGQADKKGDEESTEDQPATLFANVPMMEFVALGIGAPGMSQREIDCVVWTNRTRAKLGLRLLWADAKLSDSARMHSRDMVEHDFRAHESPLPGKKTFRDRGKIYDTRADGENIAEAPYSGEKIVEYWLDSPPHKANIVHPKFRRIGVGLHNDVWTQVFGGIDSFER